MSLYLGIDPGLASTGWGLIVSKGSRINYVEHGTISTKNNISDDYRLQHIYDSLIEIIEKNNPDGCGIETLYFNKNESSAIRVAQARGVMMLACRHKSVKLAEYTPIQIKQNVVGNGRASKDQVKMMVKLLLNMKNEPETDHAADALAAAICFNNTGGKGV